MRNVLLRDSTVTDINKMVDKVLRGLGNPKPPLDLRLVRELLKLDCRYYSTTNTDAISETLSRMKVAGKQIIKRPTLLLDVITKFDLKALYLPDQKRILLDESLPPLKHRWNEGHEISHDLLPWHAGMMLGDTEQTLTRACHVSMEAEANFATGRLLFLGKQFSQQANDYAPSFETIKKLKKHFGNTITATMWRFIEESHSQLPMIGVVTFHPHPIRRPNDFDALNPCKYFIQSPEFRRRFSGVTEEQVFCHIENYCTPKRGGIIGTETISLADDNGDYHLFQFETFFNSYEALTIGVYLNPHPHTVAC